MPPATGEMAPEDLADLKWRSKSVPRGGAWEGVDLENDWQESKPQQEYLSGTVDLTTALIVAPHAAYVPCPPGPVLFDLLSEVLQGTPLTALEGDDDKDEDVEDGEEVPVKVLGDAKRVPPAHVEPFPQSAEPEPEPEVQKVGVVKDVRAELGKTLVEMVEAEKRPVVLVIPGRENDICYHCKQKGHWKSDCPRASEAQKIPPRPRPEKLVVPGKEKDICYHCRQAGHWKIECPMNPAVRKSTATFGTEDAPESHEDSEMRKTRKAQFGNLKRLFPSMTADDIAMAMKESGNHAGKATALLQAKYQAQQHKKHELLQASAPNAKKDDEMSEAAKAAPNCVQVEGSVIQDAVNTCFVKVGAVNGRAAYLSVSGLHLWWQYNIDVRCSAGMQSQWHISDAIGEGYRACGFHNGAGEGPLEALPGTWQVAANGTWSTEKSLKISAVQAFRCMRRAMATIERDVSALSRISEGPTIGGYFEEGEQVVVLQVADLPGGAQRMRTKLGWVSRVAEGGNVLLAPWVEARKIDQSAILARRKPKSHRFAQKFAEVDGITQLPRFPALKPFHGPVLRKPQLRHAKGAEFVFTGKLTATERRLEEIQSPKYTPCTPVNILKLGTHYLRQQTAAVADMADDFVPLQQWTGHLHGAHTSMAGLVVAKQPQPVLPGLVEAPPRYSRAGSAGSGGGGSRTARVAAAAAYGRSPRAIAPRQRQAISARGAAAGDGESSSSSLAMSTVLARTQTPRGMATSQYFAVPELIYSPHLTAHGGAGEPNAKDGLVDQASRRTLGASSSVASSSHTSLASSTSAASSPRRRRGLYGSSSSRRRPRVSRASSDRLLQQEFRKILPSRSATATATAGSNRGMGSLTSRGAVW